LPKAKAREGRDAGRAASQYLRRRLNHPEDYGRLNLVWP